MRPYKIRDNGQVWIADSYNIKTGMTRREIRKSSMIRVSIDDFLSYSRTILRKTSNLAAEFCLSGLSRASAGDKKVILETLNAVGYSDMGDHYQIFFPTDEDAVLAKLKI